MAQIAACSLKTDAQSLFFLTKIISYFLPGAVRAIHVREELGYLKVKYLSSFLSTYRKISGTTTTTSMKNIQT